MTPETADLVALIAHAGQFRANGKTPYIVHPRRVAELTEIFFRALQRGDAPWMFSSEWPADVWVDDVIVAALLHDVIEDTGVTEAELREAGITSSQEDIVMRMTKDPPDEPATPEYYARIAQSKPTLIVKCADRCANLESALRSLQSTSQVRRWEKYIKKTRHDVIPMYAPDSYLRGELQARLDAIDAELPRAIARRTAEVEAERIAAGRHSWKQYEEGLLYCTRCGNQASAGGANGGGTTRSDDLTSTCAGKPF